MDDQSSTLEKIRPGVKREGVKLYLVEELERFPAERAELELRIPRFTAIGAVPAGPPFPIPMPHLPRFMREAATALALQKWAPLFYPDNGQEEYGEVVIHPLGQRLVKAAGRTPLGKAVKGHRFRLNTGNKEKHEVFLSVCHRYGRV